MREVLEKLGKHKDAVKAIGVSGQQHGFVPLDKKNKVDPPGQALVRHLHRGAVRAVRGGIWRRATS